MVIAPHGRGIRGGATRDSNHGAGGASVVGGGARVHRRARSRADPPGRVHGASPGCVVLRACPGRDSGSKRDLHGEPPVRAASADPVSWRDGDRPEDHGIGRFSATRTAPGPRPTYPGHDRICHGREMARRRASSRCPQTGARAAFDERSFFEVTPARCLDARPSPALCPLDQKVPVRIQRAPRDRAGLLPQESLQQHLRQLVIERVRLPQTRPVAGQGRDHLHTDTAARDGAVQVI